MTPEKMSLVAEFINDLAQKSYLDQKICHDYDALSDDKMLLDFLTDFAKKTNDNLEFATQPPAPPQEPPKVEPEHAVEIPAAQPVEVQIEEEVAVDPLPSTPIEYAQQLFPEALNPTVDANQEGLPQVDWVGAVDSVVNEYKEPEVWGYKKQDDNQGNTDQNSGTNA